MSISVFFERGRRLSTILLAAWLAAGCVSSAPTRPNPSFSGPYPDAFQAIARRNPLLASEIGKLPEIIDGLTAAEKRAIKDLADFYGRHAEQFDRAFQVMYRVGLPAVRRYCSPLQAVYWMAEDGTLERHREAVLQSPFSLARLLDAAWGLGRFPPFPIRASRGEIAAIVEGVKDPQRREYYRQLLGEGEGAALKAIYVDFRLTPEIFDRASRRRLRSYIEEDTRWSDFETVVERLNAPELVDYYERRRLSYEYYWNIPGYSENNPDPRWVFRHDKGDCLYITAFTVHCLRRAGYRAYEHRVDTDDPRFSFHALTVFEQEGRRYIMDNGRLYPRGIQPLAQN